MHILTIQSSGPVPDFFAHGGIAQLGERLPCKQEVTSSNLVVSTKLPVSAGRKAAMHLDNCIRKMTEKYSGQREKQRIKKLASLQKTELRVLRKRLHLLE
jgi:hypothetical protein